MTATATGREAYDALIAIVKEANLLASSASLLGWDQETLMPKGGLPFRGEQLALLSKLVHQRRTSSEVGELIAAAEADAELTGDPGSAEAVNLRELRRQYERQTKIPVELVERRARVTSEAKSVWAQARADNDFKTFAPHLQQVFDLSRQQAECYGWGDGEPWDALADNYETGTTARQVEGVFAPLREHLVALIAELTAGPTPPDTAFHEVTLPVEQQKQFVRDVVTAIGFDFNRGRLDVSTHPFCGGTHCNDVRMTTRFNENMLWDALGSTLHESGHAIYEQGLPPEHIGTPMGGAVSLGVHESQSRLWENQVGRSRAFHDWLVPQLPKWFGTALDRFDTEAIYRAANVVRPSLIRVEADEATYNLHVMVRFEIERALLRGELDVADVPATWNAKYKEYLGIDVPDDTNGCLQDIHWSMGLVGYFPTYTLGNIYSAQFFAKAQADIPDMDERFRKGDFATLKNWLNTTIHAHGKRYDAAALVEHVTGSQPDAGPLLDYLRAKLKPIYGV